MIDQENSSEATDVENREPSHVGLIALLGRLSALLAIDASSGCRERKDGCDWYEGVDLRTEEKMPLIAVCAHPGNWINPPTWRRVAVFDRSEDRDFVLAVREVLPDVVEFLRSLR